MANKQKAMKLIEALESDLIQSAKNGYTGYYKYFENAPLEMLDEAVKILKNLGYKAERSDKRIEIRW